nr:competence system putative prepilin ComGE [Streptococcus catagoni]
MLIIVSLFLDAMRVNQKFMAKTRQREEVLTAAIMAVQTKENNISVNGVTINIERNHKGIAIIEKNEKILRVQAIKP